MKSINFDYSTHRNQMKMSHLHDFCEVYYQLSGEKYYFIKNNTYYILPGDLVFIKENTLHKAFATNNNSNERILLEVNRDYLMYNIPHMNCSHLFDIFDEDIFVFRLKPKQQDIVKDIFIKMQTIFTQEKKENMDQLIILSLTLQFLIYIHKIRSSYKGQELKIQEQSFVNKRVVDITNYINDNYTKALSLE